MHEFRFLSVLDIYFLLRGVLLQKVEQEVFEGAEVILLLRDWLKFVELVALRNI
jgi:hypothetical protein